MASVATSLHRAQGPARRAITGAPSALMKSFATVPTPNEPNSTGKPKRKTYFKDSVVAPLSDFIATSSAAQPLSPTEAYTLRTAQVGPAGKKRTITRLPEWLRTPIPSGNENFKKIKSDLRGLGLHTAEALARWGLGYVVLTSVDRDDLADGGARHFAETISKIKQKRSSLLVEALTGDFMGDLDMVKVVADSGLDVYAHNVETVEALTPYVRDRRVTFQQSLRVLKHVKDVRGKEGIITKTSIMLGLGEQEHEVMDALRQLREADVDIVTFGQYMRPTKRHLKVEKYVTPDEFDTWRRRALDMGFLYCASGPLFIENVLRKRAGGKGAAASTDANIAEAVALDAAETR